MPGEKPKSRCLTYKILQQCKGSRKKSVNIAVTAKITLPSHFWETSNEIGECTNEGLEATKNDTDTETATNDTAAPGLQLDDAIEPTQAKKNSSTTAPCSSQNGSTVEASNDQDTPVAKNDTPGPLHLDDSQPVQAKQNSLSAAHCSSQSVEVIISNEQDTPAAKPSNIKCRHGSSTQEAVPSLPVRKKSRTSLSADLDDEMEETYRRGLTNGVITLHIVKCGTSGPPNTGKTLVRALMTGKKRPTERSSTAVATGSYQITPDFKRFGDVINVNGKGQMWRIFSKDSMVTAIGNTLYNKDYRSEDNGDDSEAAETSTSIQCNDSEQFESNIIRKIKKHLQSMKGKQRRKRMGLNTIRLLYFVDTGGQSQFQEILPNFIKCDINLLVHDLSKELENHPEFNYVADGKEFTAPEGMTASNLDIIETSVRSIVSAKFSREQKIYIGIVGTFKDKCCSDPADFHELLKKRSELIDDRIVKYTGQHGFIGEGKCDLVPGPSRDIRIFSVDGSEQEWDNEHPDIEDLKSKINEVMEKKRRKAIPIRYYLFLQILNEFAEKKKLEYISLDKCIAIAISSDIFMSKLDVKKALELFNEYNVLLYFPEILPEIVFVQPDFLFGKVTNLIVHSFQLKHRGAATKDYRHFSKTGIFPETLFQHVVDLPTEGNFTHESFLALLKGLYIIAELEPRYYFMPCVLPVIDPSHAELEDIKKNMQDNKIDGPLVLKFVHDMSPRGLFCSLIVALARMSGWNVNDESKLYRNLVQFKLVKKDETRWHTNRLGRVVIVNHNSCLAIYSTCPSKLCSSIRECIVEAITNACECIGYDHSDLFYTGFLCKACTSDAGILPHYTDITHLDGEWKEKCLNHIHTRRPTPLTTERLVWFAGKSVNRCTTKLLMSEVAPHTNTEWKRIGIQLDITQTKLNSIEMENPHSISDRFLAMLSCWHDNATPPFTWKTIIDVLRDVDNKRLAAELSEKYLM